MNAKTSFFNKHIFFNTLKKTLPYCITISVICFLFSFYSIKDFISGRFFWDIIPDQLTNSQVINFCTYQFATSEFCKFSMFVYSFIISVVVFSYLFNHKLCKTIHALPLTRTSMFVSNAIAGFVAIIIPYIVATITVGIYALCMGHSFFSAFIALGIDIGFSLIFYSIGILAVMLTGHILAIPIMFIFLNFGFFAIENLTIIVTHSMLFGFNEYSEMGHIIFTPIVYLFSYLTPDTSYNWNSLNKLIISDKTLIVFAIYIVLALVLLVVSGIIYKFKKLENQGDPITIKKIQPFFHYCLTIISGFILTLIISAVFEIVDDIYYFHFSDKLVLFVIFLISSVICFYILKMFINKTIRVFKNINWGLFVYGCISIIIFGIIAFDLLGFESNIPKTDKIATVKMSVDDYSIYTDDEENINKILAIHDDIIDNKNEIIDTWNNFRNDSDDIGNYRHIRIEYTKDNGSKLVRYYPIYQSLQKSPESINDLFDSAFELINSSEAIISTLQMTKDLESINIDEVIPNLSNNTTSNNSEPPIEAAPDSDSECRTWFVPEEYNDNFQKALLDDARLGNLQYAIDADEDYAYHITLYINDNNDYRHLAYKITDKCVNTLKVIEEVIEYINENNEED